MDLSAASEADNALKLSTNPRPFAGGETMAFIISVACLVISISIGIRGLMSEHAREDLPRLLDAAVLRVMISDELGVDSETGAAGDHLDNILSIYAEKGQADSRIDVEPLIAAATKIKASMDAGDRKSAVEELITFRSTVNNIEAQKFRGPINTSSDDLSLIALSICAILELLALIYLFWGSRLLKAQCRSLNDDYDKISEDFERVRAAYEDERNSGTELRQKLIDQARTTKTLDSNLRTTEERLRLLSKESNERTGLLEIRERELEELLRAAEIEKNTAGAALVALRAECQKMNLKIETSIAEVERLTLERAIFSQRVEAIQQTSTLVEDRIVAAESKAKKIETDYTILEWSNVKLKALNEDLAQEIVKLKAEMESEAKRFRDQLASLRG
jgi:hypothetical protein